VVRRKRRTEHLHSGVTVVLQWCYSGATVVLHWCYSGAPVVLQWCYSGVTVVLQRCFNVVKEEEQETSTSSLAYLPFFCLAKEPTCVGE
jgi:hypothetical protein